jgi:hypothetical protein
MFSYGTQQGIKLLFVVGEQGLSASNIPQGIEPPSLDGIFLGNAPLEASLANQFALYWRRNTTLSGTGRVRAGNLLYGTRGTPSSGDPETANDVFSCPTGQARQDTGFSSAHSLSNNQAFGCYGSIPNGTGYRVNWRIVGIPKLTNDGDNYARYGDKNNVNHNERLKIAGISGPTSTDIEFRKKLQADGMPGLGRNYSRRMGIMAHNSLKIAPSEGNRIVNVVVKDKIVFKISKAQLPDTFFYSESGVTTSDINSALNEERIAADDALQLGELFMVGRTMWKVISRSIPQWRPEDGRSQFVTLECVEILGSPRVGVVSEDALDRDFLWDISPNQYGMGPAYFPLQKVSVGVVRNNRACEVTEIGIKSRVFQRLNGLCNFQSLPTPARLTAAENDRVNLVSGTISTFTRRASGFTIYLRPTGNEPGSSKPYGWEPLGENFVIVGNQPVDVYNFLQIKHPTAGQWEFRFIPKNGADIGANDSEGTRYWQLNANTSIDTASSANILSSSYTTKYGVFTVTGVGQIVDKSAIRSNAELAQAPTVTLVTESGTNQAEQVLVNKLLPENDSNTEAISGSSVSNPVTYQVNPSNATEGFIGAFSFELFGDADSSGIPLFSQATKVIRHDLTSTRWVKIQYTYERRPLAAGHWSGRNSFFIIRARTVTGSSVNWQGVNFFVPTATISSGNPFRNPPGSSTLQTVGEVHTVTSRIPGPIGIRQGFLEEVHGPARNFNVGTSRTSTVSYTEGSRTIELRLTSVVEVGTNQPSGETRIWSAPLVTINFLNTTTDWQVGNTFIVNRTISATNPFRVSGTSVGMEFVINSLQQAAVKQVITAERIFETQSQYADVSFYGGLIEKSNANDSEHTIAYVNEIVSNPSEPNYDRLTVCGLALKASRNFTAVDQLRMWLPTGIPVVRFHPDEGGNLPLTSTARMGPSNLFCDLVYYLLTDQVAGLGVALGMTPSSPDLVDTGNLSKTARFLKTNKLFFDGAITSSSNFRAFVAETAPLFLCNFVISNGKFSLLPALPTTASGEISSQPVVIKQLFTAGNIVEETFQLEYLTAEERKPFKAVVRFREERPNQLPEERNIVVRWADENEYSPTESFDLTAFCTNRQHAELVGRFLLSIRKRVAHTVRFKTLPFGISLAPGDYIRVITEASPYNAARNGSIGASGEITSATDIANGTYSLVYYKLGEEDILEGTATVNNGVVLESKFYGSIFTIMEAVQSQNVYMVEQLTIEDDGTVLVSASEFPCDDRLVSLLAQDLLPAHRDRFAFEG